jgi:hypothetical protein
MRSFIFILFLTCLTTFSFGQNSAFQTLKNKFAGDEDVVTFSTSGFFARVILWMSGEHEFQNAVQNIDQIRLITIPKSLFETQKVTVGGFKKILTNDAYEVLSNIRDHGDDVTVYIQSGKEDHNNRYFVLVDNENEVVGIEIKGYIDPELMLKQSRTDTSYNQ